MITGAQRSRLALAAVILAELIFPTGPRGLFHLGSSTSELSQAQIVSVLSALNQHNESLLSTPGVVGTALGLGLDGQPVVKVYLAEEGVLGIPAALNGVPTTTEVTGRFFSYADPPESLAARGVDRTSHFPRPVPIGVSSGQTDVSAGTIGARVKRGDDLYALSNNHVFANSNRAKPGDLVLQPGVVDGGRAPDDAIGTLADFEPIGFCRPAPLGCPVNRIDAAIAAVDAENLDPSTPEDGYGMPRSQTADANLTLRVQKYGRTTGLTSGTVSGIFATVNVDYRIGVARFVDQIIISSSSGPFSAPGDSGSLVVTKGKGAKDRRPVGLLFGGSRLTTIVSPIDLVLDRFDVAVDGEA